MTRSPAQQRLETVWGNRCPRTRVSVAGNLRLDEDTLARRLKPLAANHAVLHNWGFEPSKSPEAVLMLLERGSDGEVLTMTAPTRLLDAAAAMRVVGWLLTDSAPPTAPDYDNVAAWWWETLGMRAADGISRWDATDHDWLPAPPLPWGTVPPAETLQLRRRPLEFLGDERSASLLRGCAERLEVSAADVLCALWVVFLARWLDTDTVLLADVHDGRSLPELAPTLGLMERVLPLDIRVNPRRPFDQLARQIARERREAYAEQDYFIMPGGAPSRAYLPLGFSYRDPGALSTLPKGVRLTALTSEVEPCALQLSVCATERAWLGSLDSATGVFGEAEAAAAALAFIRLAHELLAEPTLAIDAPWLGGQPVPTTPSISPLRQPGKLGERLTAALATYGSRLAIVDDQGELSYAELAAASTSLRARLSRAGACRGARIAIHGATCRQTLIAVAASICMGASYVPIDASAPAARVRKILADCRARVLVWPSADQPDGLAIEALAAGETSDSSAESEAYVIYTSGSTGEPKGASLPDRAVLHLVEALGSLVYDALQSPVRVSLLASLAFDASVQQIFAAWLGGHTLVPLSPELKRDPQALCEFLGRHAVELLDCTPSLLDLLARLTPRQLGSSAVRTILVGGEPLGAATVRRLYDCPGTARLQLINVYGLSECGVDSVAMRIDAGWTGEERVPIGLPMAHAEVWLLDAQQRPVPCGAVGELYIGGPGLLTHYINDAELTQAKLVPHPTQHGARLFRTGDYGFCDGSGLLHLIGRRDEQVKVRGHRVDLGEVRAALCEVAGVDDAAVIIHHTSAGAELAAFVVAAAKLDLAAVRAALRERLSVAMLPRYLRQVPRLPMTVSGKLDRQELLAGLSAPPAMEPRSAGVSQQIAEILGRVLGNPSFTADDDFFLAGGHSLLALESVAKLTTVLGRDLELRLLYENPTPAALAGALSEAVSGRRRRLSPLLPVRVAGKPPVVFLPSLLGVSMAFAPHAKLLGSSYDAWGFDYHGLGVPLPGSLAELSAELSAELVTELGERLPAGRIPLVGYSLGAAVAFEMARLLHQRGYTPSLVLIDRMPSPPRIADGQHASAYTRAMRALADDYKLHGDLDCDAVLIEAANNPISTGMADWKHHVRGRIHHTRLPQTHDSILRPEHATMLTCELQHALEFLLGPSTTIGVRPC